jgi:hypothetical protein
MGSGSGFHDSLGPLVDNMQIPFDTFVTTFVTPFEPLSSAPADLNSPATSFSVHSGLFLTPTSPMCPVTPAPVATFTPPDISVEDGTRATPCPAKKRKPGTLQTKWQLSIAQRTICKSIASKPKFRITQETCDMVNAAGGVQRTLEQVRTAINNFRHRAYLAQAALIQGEDAERT